MSIEQLQNLAAEARSFENADKPTFTMIDEPPKKEVPEVPTGDVIAGLLVPTFALIALRAGEHWNIDADEAKIAGDAYGDVIDKYFPDVGSSMGVEITACMVTAGLFMPRLMVKKEPPQIVDDNHESKSSTAVNFGNVENIKGGKTSGD